MRMLSQVSSTMPTPTSTAADRAVLTIEAMVLLDSWSAFAAPIAGNSIVSSFRRSRVLATSSFSLNDILAALRWPGSLSDMSMILMVFIVFAPCSVAYFVLFCRVPEIRLCKIFFCLICFPGTDSAIIIVFLSINATLFFFCIERVDTTKESRSCDRLPDI